MKVRSAVPAGIVDAGFAALAAFATSIYAARVFDTTLLGFYAVFFTAFLTAAQISGSLIMMPLEIHAMTISERQRMSLLFRCMPSSLSISVLASAFSALIGVAITFTGGLDDPFPFALTVFAAGVVSSFQDHIRRMLHAAGRSWLASTVSIVQCVGVLAAMFAMIGAGVEPVWIPFASLGIANVLSSSAGLVFSRSRADALSKTPPSIREQLRTGRWLMATGLLGPVGGLVVQSVVIAIAGASILGLAEAARVVGRPILVLSTGLGQALAPKSISAAQQRQRKSALRMSRVFVFVFALGGLAYTAVVSFDWVLNIAEAVIPNAYIVPGLVLAVCVSNIAVGLSFPGRYELLGGDKERWVTMTELVGQLGRSLVSAGTAILGAFVIAVGDTVLGLVRLIGYRAKLPSIYEHDRGEVTGGPSSSTDQTREQ